MPTLDVATLLRAPSIADAPVLGRIAYEAFGGINRQHNFPPDFPSVEVAAGFMEMMLSIPTIQGIVAEREGRAIGSAFLWPDGSIGGVGPVTVEPEVQDGKVGKQMMRWIVDRADAMGLDGIRLVQAAFHNRSMALYTKLGFDVVEPLSVVQGTAKGGSISKREVRAMIGTDIADADALCEKVHGIARSGELIGAVMRGEASAVYVQGRMTGYTTGIGFFGHSVAESSDDLKALILSAPEIAGPGMLIPTRNSELLRWCLEQGLRIQYPATLMARGRYQEPQGAFLPSILY
jgi:GNAT superfamily N-acetyltransferase